MTYIFKTYIYIYDTRWRNTQVCLLTSTHKHTQIKRTKVRQKKIVRIYQMQSFKTLPTHGRISHTITLFSGSQMSASYSCRRAGENRLYLSLIHSDGQEGTPSQRVRGVSLPLF